MQVRFLVGPAGSGKTWRCLAEIRRELARRPDGPPLVLLAPKQATFQLERQLLAEGGVAAYTRLRIVSFARLADLIGERLGAPPARILSEQGRLMALRAVLLRNEGRLGIFRASAGRPGFARELGALLRELQQQRVGAEGLRRAAGERGLDEALRGKLTDLALLLEAYTAWLREHGWRDADEQLERAAEGLRAARPGRGSAGASPGQGDLFEGATGGPGAGEDSTLTLFGGVWLDGFSELTPGERWLLRALAPRTPGLTITFCLESEPAGDAGWLSTWSPIAKLYQACHGDFSGRKEVELRVEVLPRSTETGRFSGSPMLAFLERHWGDGRGDFLTQSSPRPQSGTGGEGLVEGVSAGGAERDEGVELYEAASPEQEAALACREIRRFARAGGRYRDAAILLRRMEVYEDVLPPLLDRYDIPYFIDRREPLARHPLAALTHYALRALAQGWEAADLFGAWKTGFFPVAAEEIDRLENLALARGWHGSAWRAELPAGEAGEETDGTKGEEGPAFEQAWKRAGLDATRRALIGPLEELAAGLEPTTGTGLNGAALAGALERFWGGLEVERRLTEWDGEEKRGWHLAAWREMKAWRETLLLAFADQELPLDQWLVIAEAGLAGLTAGTIPPALDQVLIGAIDRSRNPDLQLAVVLGLNEGVFPLAPPAPKLLTEPDRAALGPRLADLPGNRREFLGRERFLGYIACTRARKRLVLARAARDLEGEPLNASPFFARVKSLFPELKTKTVGEPFGWETAEHPSELLGRALREERAFAGGGPLGALAHLPVMRALHARLPVFRALEQTGRLARELVGQRFGIELRTSVSALQRFASCPFQFLVHATLRGRERDLFELGARERGSFFHEVLAAYHGSLAREGRLWREVGPEEARERARGVAGEVARSFGHGLLRAGAAARFSAEIMSRAVVEFIEAETAWMRRYSFDPWKAEARFTAGATGGADLPAWRINLDGGRTAVIEGQIDRVDRWRDPVSGEAHAVVVDYKSRKEILDETLMSHGIVMQLPAYLNVLTRAGNEASGARLEPAGMFYAPLKPSGETAERRTAPGPAGEAMEARWRARQFRGRFALELLGEFDRAAGPGGRGSHFSFQIKKDGAVTATTKDAIPRSALRSLLEQNETTIRRIAERIYEGEAGLDPWKKGGKSACDHCDCRAICRTDPWTQTFRTLAGSAADEARGS